MFITLAPDSTAGGDLPASVDELVDRSRRNSEKLVDAVADFDEELMELVLEDQEIPVPETFFPMEPR